ncbi:hypothetical protein GNF82_12095 [Clostridium perfringens]
MALNGSYYWESEYPKMRIDVSYSQTARTGTNATYSVSVALYFISSGWYGYGMNGKVTINGTSQEIRFKNPSPTWDGSGYKGTWTFNITASAGSGGGTLPANVRVWGTDGDGTVIDSGSQVVTLSTWNTAPTWTGDGNVNGWTSSQIISENTTSVTVNFPPTKDNEGNTVYYDVYRYVNGSSNAKIASGSTARVLTDNISGTGQGDKIKYLFQTHDGSLWASGDKWTIEHTKNIFSPGEISGSGVTIGYDTTSIKLNVTAARNTNGNGSFTYRLGALNGITVTNGNFTPDSNGQVTLSVYKGGTRPSTPHIDFDQLKEYSVKGAYVSTLVLRLYSSNAYGSNSYTDVTVTVNLRTNPVPAAINTPTGEVTVAGAKYFVWNLSTVNVSWAAGVDKLAAGALSYELQYRYGSGTWTRLTTTNSTSWSGMLPEVASLSTCSFRVIATTTYGYSSTSTEKSITMHYYKPPIVSVTNPNRTQSEFSITVNSSTSTSIATVAISSRTFKGKAGTDMAFAGASTTIKDTGLGGDSNYNLVIKVTDNSGLANATTTYTVNVAQYIPIVSITDTGVAINALPSSNYKLTIGGDTSVDGQLSAKAINSNGYATSYTGGSDYNKWTKIATVAITTRYQEVTSIIDVLDYGSGNNVPVKAELSLRVKQQGEMGTAPSCSMYLSSYITTSPDNFKLIVTQNTATKTEVQLWFKNVQSWSTAYFVPRKANGYLNTITFHELQPFQVSLPSGTQIPCYKITNNTPGDIGAATADHTHSNYVSGTGENCVTKVSDTRYVWKAGFYDLDEAGINKPFGGWNWLINTGHSNNSNGGPRYGMQIAGQNETNNFAIRTLNYNGDGQWNSLYHNGNNGEIGIASKRISNLNPFMASGWYSFSTGTNGAPCSYGTLLHIAWNEWRGKADPESDFTQVVFDLGNTAIYRRNWVNNSWKGWVTIT